jgi:hypothetical protein
MACFDAAQVFGLAFGRIGYHGFRSAYGVTKFLEKTARVFDEGVGIDVQSGSLDAAKRNRGIPCHPLNKGTQAQNPVHHPLPAMIEILPAVGIITAQKSTTNTGRPLFT